MADMTVDTYKLKQYAQRISAVNNRIKRLDQRMDSLYTKVGLVDLCNLIQADALTSYSIRLKRCQTYLEQTATDLETTEKFLSEQDPVNFQPPVVAWLDDALSWIGSLKETSGEDHLKDLHGMVGATIVTGVAESILSRLNLKEWGSFWKGEVDRTIENALFSWTSDDGDSYLKLLSGVHTTASFLAYGSYKDKKLLGDKDHLNVNKSQEKIPIKKINDDNWYTKKGTIMESGLNDQVEGSVFSAGISGSSEYAEGSVDVDLLTGEVHAGVTAGVYMYTKDKDGNVKKIFSPGVSAEIGASASVFEIEAAGRLGLGEDKNMLGVYGDVDLAYMTGEAQAKLALNGKEVYVGASAEADLVKVGGSGGVSVLGTDVGVSGSLKVGVGGHAEVGFTDGKLKVDVGAAIGVGFDLGFEVDVSGTVDAISDVATSAWDSISDKASDFGDSLKSIFGF